MMVYSLSLSHFLADNNINVEGVNEVNIPIHVRFEGTNVHVDVMDWNSEDVDPIV